MTELDQGPRVVVESFGYLWGGPPTGAVVVVDVREHFRDPHRDPQIRELTARDAVITARVLATEGVAEVVEGLIVTATGFVKGPVPRPALIAVGCAGGRHRSAAIADEVVTRLRADGIAAAVSHRDIDRPVVKRAISGPPA